MNLDLADKRVLVTAGASGIGLRIARAFLAEGARVELCDVDEAALDALASEAPAVGRHLCDVADRTAVEAMMGAVATRLGGLDILINNAGIAGPTAPVDKIDPLGWDRTLAVNITGMFNVTRLAVAPLRTSGGGAIVNISSAAGRFGFPNRTPYAASKWGVVGFTKTLAMELGGDGIRVNAVLPGSVAGPRIEGVFAAKAREAGVSLEAFRQAALSTVSIKELVPPERVADLVVFLASSLGANISGQAIGVDNDTQSLF